MAQRNPLYAVPPAEFTKARDALAKELRSAGKEDEAKSVASMRKPTAVLWTVNQLARIAHEDVDALLDAAKKLRRAHESGDSGALRAAMQEQRDALRALEGAAEKAAQEIGAKPSPDFQRRVQATAQSAAASEPEKLREGALDEELEPAGFESLMGTHVAQPMHAPHAAGQKKHDPHGERELKKAEHAADELSASAKRLELAAVQAQEAAAEARRKADEARKAAQEARAFALDLRKKL